MTENEAKSIGVFSNDYQNFTATTQTEGSKSFHYLMFGLTSEVGELAGLEKRIVREKQGVRSPEDVESAKKELGDIAWYVARLANFYGFQLSDVFAANVKKLADRKERGVIHGKGDNR